MAVPTDVLARAVARVRAELPGSRLDDWAPSVQGAVGHVVGLRGADASPQVLKVYSAEHADRLAAEVLALRLAAPVPGLDVPRVLLSGTLAHPDAAGFVLMTRLPGTRWADLRPSLAPAPTAALTREVGAALRRLHGVTGERFGSLVDRSATVATAWERVAGRTSALLSEYVRTGGPSALAGRVRQLVEDRRAALESCTVPGLCHLDFIDGNLLLTGGPEPRLAGVVDFEAAVWDDPLSDLAQTRVHVRFHRPQDVGQLLAGYGVSTEEEHERLEVHDVLHVVRERAWIALDRPQGWQRSADALDRHLAAST